MKTRFYASTAKTLRPLNIGHTLLRCAFGLLLLALLLPSGQSVHAHAVAHTTVNSGIGITKWWEHLTGEKTINVRSDGKTLNDIKGQLDTLKSNGYHVVNIDWPVQAGPVSLYGGFSASDFYHVEPSLGTDQDWLDFVSAAHSKGIAVDAWFNASYLWTGSSLFKQAEADVKTYGTNHANLPANSPAQYFEWRSQAGDVNKPCDTCGGSYSSGRWVTDADAGSNVSYYGVWSDQPSGDYSTAEWRTYIVGVLNHWLDTGLDGFIFDAPSYFINCDGACMKATIVGTVHNYGPDRLAASETPRDSSAISTYGFDATTDSAFWGDGAATNAITNNNPSGIEAKLSNRDDIVNAGGTDYSAPDFTKTSDAATHLLQAATIATSGNFLVIWDPGTGFGKLDTWAGEGPNFAKITNAVTDNVVLQSEGARKQVTTNDDAKYYAFVRTSPDGRSNALVIFNYQGSQQTITTRLNGFTVANQTTTDLLNGGNGPGITNNTFSVTLDAYGYGFYSLTTSSGGTTQTTKVDDNANGWTYGNGWDFYSDSGAYNGTAHGGQTTGAYGQYSFTGTAVTVYVWKAAGAGTVEVFIDNVSQGTFSEDNGGGDTYDQVLFSKTGLSSGTHTVKLVATNDRWSMVDYITYTA